MNISQESDYALRAIRAMYNFGVENKIEARIISEKEHIPIRFLFKILRKLCAENIIESFRGVNGGYMLKAPLEKLNLKDIIEAIEGPISINKCTKDKNLCEICLSGCSLYYEMKKVENEILNILSRKSLKEILDSSIDGINFF